VSATHVPAAGEVIELDVRDMDPPEPLVLTLAALDRLPPGATLVQVNTRVPQHLLPQLEARGFSYTLHEDDDVVRVEIRRSDAAAVSSAEVPEGSDSARSAAVVAPAAAPSSANWRDDIPESRRPSLRLWLWSIAAMTFGVLVVGGITRLTMSGLSIVDWKPLMGVIPPLNEAQWQATFELYRQFPEYQIRQGMTLGEFKFIFFWEYLHRLLARGIGVVFLVPFVVFLVRGWLTPPLLRRSLALFGLGAMQGVMGWLMVSSGLVDRPSVSHYRLAAHLSLAFVIFGYALWLARDLRADTVALRMSDTARRLMLRGLAVVGGLMALQIVWGAFVAGLRAGKFYNTFPLMGGRLVPAELLHLEPALLNAVANPVAVQWVHRVLGTVLLTVAALFYFRVRQAQADSTSLRLNSLLLGGLVAQFALGVATLVYAVPVVLGVAHQAAAMVLFGVWLYWFHHVRSTSSA
jgi:heme a synthase